MKKIQPALWVLGVILSACSKPGGGECSLYINGDESFVNAEVFVDDRLAGKMIARIYEGAVGENPKMEIKKGTVFSIGVDRRFLDGNKAPPYGGDGVIIVARGKHQLKIITVKGKVLEAPADFQTEEYVGVDEDDKELIIHSSH